MTKEVVFHDATGDVLARVTVTIGNADPEDILAFAAIARDCVSNAPATVDGLTFTAQEMNEWYA